MHNTPPPPPVCEQDTATLIDDLCVALRDVGVFDAELPGGPRVLRAINGVRSIKQVLDERGVQVADRLATLSGQTGWRMAELLCDCLSFPAVVPYVKEADGIRRRLRCRLCRKAECPPDARYFCWMCDGCLTRVVESIRTRTPIDGIFLFRTYNPTARCKHADSDTVLAQAIWIETINGNCEQCFQGELDRRAQSASTHPLNSWF
jgi:hypothetical protein